MSYYVDTEVNEHGVTVKHIFINNMKAGEMFSTYHPTIPYEVYSIDYRRSKRVMCEGDAVEWLKSLDNEVSNES